MCSAIERFPRCSTLLTSWVTTTDRYTGSGMRSRRDAGPLRGIRLSRSRRLRRRAAQPHFGVPVRCSPGYPARGRSPSALLLRAVAAAGLVPARHAARVERAAHDLVPHTGEVTDTATAHQHDRVLLEVVPLAGDVRGDLDARREAHPGDLAQCRIRLLRRRRVDARAHSPALRGALQRRRLRLRRLRSPPLPDKLLNRGHAFPSLLFRAARADKKLSLETDKDRHLEEGRHRKMNAIGERTRAVMRGLRGAPAAVGAARSGVGSSGARAGGTPRGRRLPPPARTRRTPEHYSPVPVSSSGGSSSRTTVSSPASPASVASAAGVPLVSASHCARSMSASTSDE